METNIRGKHVNRLRKTLGFVGCFAVDNVGLRGGIGLFWSKDVSVELKNYVPATFMLWCVMIYLIRWNGGSLDFTERLERKTNTIIGVFLRTLYGIRHSAWLCISDFNKTLYVDEHFSQAAYPGWQMRAFCEVTNKCALQNLGWSGVAFMWDN